MTTQAPGIGSFFEQAPPNETREARESRREAFRAKRVAEIPAGYSPTLHLLGPASLAVAVLVVSVWLIHDLRAVELLTIPITLFLGFGFEWRVHKSILHARTPGFSILYVRHELQHHVIYTHDDMTMRDRRERRLVMMPGYAIVLVFGMLVPLGFVVWRLLGLNVTLIFLATSMIFFLVYELMHLAYHLPPEHPVSKIRLVQRLRELHRRHHDPRLMKRWNFNVTFPVFDWIHGTNWTEERERERDEKRAARAVKRA